MTYDPNIPQPTDLLSDSVVDLRINFQAANTSFGVNHYNFADPSNKNGKHNFIEIPIQTTMTGLPAGLALLEATIYSRTIGGSSQVFYTPDQSTNQYQIKL